MNLNGVKLTGERLTQNNRPGFSVITAAGYLQSALKQADREPMGALCGVCLLASGRNRTEDSHNQAFS